MRANYGVAAKTAENITVKKPVVLSTTGLQTWLRQSLIFQVATCYIVLVKAVGGFVTVLLGVVATLAGTLAAAADVGGYAVTGAVFGLHVGVKVAVARAGAQAVSKVRVGAALAHVVALLAVGFFIVLAALLAAAFGVFVVVFGFSSHEWKRKGCG
jgi:hypothetical protein